MNLALAIPPLAAMAKLAGGIAPQRKIPELAPVRFKKSFARRNRRLATGTRVVLFPDTFNDFFHPDVAHAAVDVLERAGFDVAVPQHDLCCGRPFYDFGMLDQAKRYLRRVIDVLRPALEQGTPIVVLEPSCAAVFRDELVNLFPNDWGARRLHDQVISLAELLEKKAPHFSFPELSRKALVHGHCHQKALEGIDHDKKILERMKIDAHVPETGCCGMAGSFGFERGEKYDVSVKCGERVLLPEVRKATSDTIVLADGFSCREQIAQQTDRHALHLAQVIQLGLEGGPLGRPESQMLAKRRRARRDANKRALLAAGAACAAVVLTSVAMSRR